VSEAGTVYRIAAIPGDGVGPEVAAAARAVLDSAGKAFGFAVEWSELLAGGAAIDAYGTAMRDEDVAAAGEADAILLGAVGGPKWDDPKATVRPEQSLFALRGGLGLFANLRPVSVHPALVASSPLRADLLEGVDLLIVRELTGGLYFGGRTEAVGEVGKRIASDTLPYSEPEIRRVVKVAFELAQGRRHRLTSVDKANVLATSRLWREVAHEVAREHPDVAFENVLVDAMAMHLLRRPRDFDVIATENLFGDILTDEASMLTGSMGLLPSASLPGMPAPGQRLRGLYEPIHGSAPDIAGRDKANPLAAILSVALCCRYSLGAPDAAAAIEQAVASVVASGHRTADIAAPGERVVGCREMGRLVRNALGGT